VDTLFLNGQPCEYQVVSGIGRGRIKVVTNLTGRIECRIFYQDVPLPALVQNTLYCFAGEHASIQVANGTVDEVLASTDVTCEDAILSATRSGTYDLLVKSGSALLPLALVVKTTTKPQQLSPKGTMEFVSIPFNTALTEVHNQQYRNPRPAGYSIGVRLNGRYAWEWNHYGHNALQVEDTALRQGNGVFEVPSGAQFATPAVGNNVLAVSIWDNFPTTKEIPLCGKAQRLHLFLAGSTNAMQSKVVNARCTVRYQDGRETWLDLIQPQNFDDFLIPTYQREAEPFYVSDGTHGLHLILELDEALELQALCLEAVANEVVLMLLGATLERP